MALILPVLMKAKPAGLLFETANPRHQHDAEAFADNLAAVPDDKVLIPGVIDSTTNFIEHPKVVANRLRPF
ncbi:epoxyalkane--coenzyme M transferase, partial [Acinetobacter baumannii]